jgi:hypothetical protein
VIGALNFTFISSSSVSFDSRFLDSHKSCFLVNGFKVDFFLFFSWAMFSSAFVFGQKLALVVGGLGAAYVATPLWPSVGVKPNTMKSWGFGVLRDSQMFRARQQGPKHLALGCSWCHWKGLEE